MIYKGLVVLVCDKCTVHCLNGWTEEQVRLLAEECLWMVDDAGNATCFTCIEAEQRSVE